MQLEHSFFVGIQDVGANNEITNKALLEAFTNITNLQGKLAGQGTNDKTSSHLSWVVLNWKLQVAKRPKVCESILVKTWAQQYNRLQASRDYDVFNESGEKVAQATSVWAAINVESRSLARLSPEIMDVYGCEPEHQNFPGFKFGKIRKQETSFLSSQTFTIHKAMIDCNHHVHNPAYLDLAAEGLPEGLDTVLFDNMEVSYKKEIRPGETVLIEYVKDAERHTVFISDHTDSSLHAAIILY